MGFRTQRLANAFPLWTKTRRDPSSLAHRLFETFAEMTEEQTITAVKISQDRHLLKSYLGTGRCYTVALDDGDLYPQAETSNSVLKYTYPTVVGTLDGVDYTLTRVEELTSFLNSPPDRLVAKGSRNFSTYEVWTSTSPYSYVDPPWPERLALEVKDSTFYSRRSRTEDREYSGKHVIQIAGLDENNIKIREYVQVLDDGVFYTRNFFKTVTEIAAEGFNGTIVARWFPYQHSWEVDPYRQAVFDDFEGQLMLSLSTQVVDGITYSYVEYSSARLKLGEKYRRTGNEAPDNTEILAEVVLLNSSGNPYTAVDLAINHETSKLYVLDAQGSLHVYDHELSSFEDSDYADTETARTYMELIPLRHRAKYGDAEYLYTDFARNRFGIIKIEIKRTSPDGTVEYLQSDKSTWNSSQAYIVAFRPDAKTPEQTWQDFRFSTQYDQLGQWEYTCTTISSKDTTVYTTAVLVSKMVAERSLDTDVSSCEGLAFSREGYVAVSDGFEVHYFEEASDTWLADVRLGQVLMHNKYDSIEISY